jgi:hypothetical protein
MDKADIILCFECLTDGEGDFDLPQLPNWTKLIF